MKISAQCIGLIALVSASMAHAGTPFSHPAIGGAVQGGAQQLADASPVIVGHPASPRWKHVHANGEHPAVIVAARQPALDPNLFIVQPPASVQWTLGPVPDAQVAAAAR